MLEGLHAFWRLLGRICFLAFLISSDSYISSIPWLLTPCQQLHHSKLSFIITASLTLLPLPLVRIIMITLGPLGDAR